MPQLSARSGPLTPEDNIRRVLAGDSVAMGELYSRYADALFRTAYRITGSRPDAEDILHDLFVGLPDALRRYVDRGSFDAWLTRIVVRLALMRTRADRRRRTAPLDEARALATSQHADADLELTELQHAVMALPHGLRAVFMLKQVEGYSHDEIGTLLGITAGASRVRLVRALETLRHSLR